jgi:predicted phosphodiesterase
MTFGRVAALYDIHGNLTALEAVLADVDASAVDLIVVGGDVANGPMPAGSLDVLDAAHRPVRFVCGNGDRELVDAYDGRPAAPGLPPEWAELQQWAAAGLTRAHRDSLAAYEPTVVVDVEGLGSVCFCHGSPRSDEEILTELTPVPRLAAALDGVSAEVVVCGHTHIGYDRRVGRLRVVNASSVGLPYEGAPGAYWALLGPDVTLRRTPYDLEAAVARIRATGCPAVEETFVDTLLHPPERLVAAQHFERAATAGGVEG